MPGEFVKEVANPRLFIPSWKSEQFNFQLNKQLLAAHAFHHWIHWGLSRVHLSPALTFHGGNKALAAEQLLIFSQDVIALRIFIFISKL